jgi:hypothetical protein
LQCGTTEPATTGSPWSSHCQSPDGALTPPLGNSSLKYDCADVSDLASSCATLGLVMMGAVVKKKRGKGIPWATKIWSGLKSPRP